MPHGVQTFVPAPLLAPDPSNAALAGLVCPAVYSLLLLLPFEVCPLPTLYAAFGSSRFRTKRFIIFTTTKTLNATIRNSTTVLMNIP